ncbi:MAG: helix-turn-helix domain-containing protein [Pseudomonadota bacterium]|nr:helix-turn-helix domain-containing protein [Pseudomonadota bacterium]
MLAIINRFRDANLHAAAVPEWRQTYNQISPGALHSSLMQLTTRNLHVFREYLDQRVVQRGVAPAKKLCFAVPARMPVSARVQGRSAPDNSLFVLQSGEEFVFHMPMHTDMLSITLDYAAFEGVLAAIMAPECLGAVLRQPVIHVPEHRMADVRKSLLAMFAHAMTNPHLLKTPAAQKMLEHSLVGAVLELLTDPACDKSQRPSTSSQVFIVDKCHQIAMASGDMPVTIIDLCARLRTSPRTIQNSFLAVTQTTPVDYLRSIRLNAVRRQLLATSAIALTVGEAAAVWGFFHLSHFAVAYKSLFGELPSQTRRAVAPLALPPQR